VIEFGRLAEENDILDAEPDGPPLSIVAAPTADDELEASERLEVIERHLTVLEAEFAPPAADETSAAHGDPFGGQFVEDEVVIDRYASLDAGGAQQRPQVFCQEGDALTRLLHQAAPQTDVVVPPSASIPASASIPVAVVNPPPAPPVANAAQVPKQPSLHHSDDADIVVVEDDPKVLPVTVHRPGARREEYRNLFAKLRRG
jgi:hypothetical protein